MLMVTVCHVATKGDDDCLYSDFDLFCDRRILTFDLDYQYVSVLSQYASVGEIWWGYVKKFVSYVWPSTRTHKQTNK